MISLRQFKPRHLAKTTCYRLDTGTEVNMSYLIFLLPLACAGFKHDGITINIAPAPNEANVTIQHKGEDIKVITDADVAAFNLTKDKIDEAVKVFSGEKATDVFTKSPTSWGDLYQHYKWRDIKRQFKIKSIKLVNVTLEKMIVEPIEEYSNNSTEVKEVKGDIFNAYDAFTSEHYWTGNLEVLASVKYELLRPYSPRPLNYGYISKVGQDPFGSGTHIITYANIGATFKLEPGQKAKLYLKANAVVTRINVDYETILSGDLAVNYENDHEGHQHWAYDVNEVLAASNLTTTVLTNEYVKIEYLTDFETKVVDATTGEDIKFM